MGQLCRPGQLLPVVRAARPNTSAQRGRRAGRTAGLHHRRTDRLRAGLAGDGPRGRQAVLSVSQPQGRSFRPVARRAARGTIRRRHLRYPGKRGGYARKPRRQADVGLQPAQHLARNRLLLQFRHADDGISALLFLDPVRGRRQRRPDSRLVARERAGRGHPGRIHFRQRLPVRRPRPDRQAQRLPAFGARAFHRLPARHDSGGNGQSRAHPQSRLRPHLSRPCRRRAARTLRRPQRLAPHQR